MTKTSLMEFCHWHSTEFLLLFVALLSRQIAISGQTLTMVGKLDLLTYDKKRR
jgi:hypothetical protein